MADLCQVDVIVQVIDDELDDIKDLSAGLAALKDPPDPVLEWPEVRDALFGVDEPDAM